MKALAVGLVLFFFVWDGGWWLFGLPQTLPWTLRGALDQGPRPQLLDVRTPAEYALFHIPGAVNRPEALVGEPARLGLDPDRPVVVVCLTGHRSPFVVRKLRERGATKASNLAWGMLGWLLSGGRVVGGD